MSWRASGRGFRVREKYGGPNDNGLYPTTATQEAWVEQWTLWAQGHLEPWAQKDLLLADLIRTIGERGGVMICRSLDRTLARAQWLVGSRFTAGDLKAIWTLVRAGHPPHMPRGAPPIRR